MNDKEKKLREALNEYFGSDVGDIANVDGETTSYAACPARFERHIDITTVPHKLTFEERRKKLVDQLDKDLKEIDDNFNVVEGMENPDVTYIRCSTFPYCELYLYLNGNVDFHGAYGSVKQMTKAMEAISVFSWELRQLKEQYEDETI